MHINALRQPPSHSPPCAENVSDLSLLYITVFMLLFSRLAYIYVVFVFAICGSNIPRLKCVSLFNIMAMASHHITLFKRVEIQNERSLQLLQNVVQNIQVERPDIDPNMYELFVGVSEPTTSVVQCPPREPSLNEEGYIIVYTNFTRPRGITAPPKISFIDVWWEENHSLNVNYKSSAETASDIQACTKACIIAHKLGISKLCIKTSSTFVINCMTIWIRKWLGNGWKTIHGNDVKNKCHLKKLYKISQLLDVKYESVPTSCASTQKADSVAIKEADMDMDIE